jgi:hypothetical protein
MSCLVEFALPGAVFRLCVFICALLSTGRSDCGDEPKATPCDVIQPRKPKVGSVERGKETSISSPDTARGVLPCRALSFLSSFF